MQIIKEREGYVKRELIGNAWIKKTEIIEQLSVIFLRFPLFLGVFNRIESKRNYYDINIKVRITPLKQYIHGEFSDREDGKK